MSDRDSEEEDEDAGEDDTNNGQGAFDKEDATVQRKLHIFQCSSVQLSIKRLWDLLPKDDQSQLVMEGYVELNLRFQKALTQEFVLERAIDSAIGDWSEDVREGQRSMTESEFAMFLFELCSLWCGPSVSLLVYLLFLNATFITVTDARGSHTVGLRPLAAIERLPQSFFDLLSVQGWAKQPEDGAGLDEEKALNVWLVRNLSPDNEQATRLQVQRQVFQVTHDVRSVLLFRDEQDRGETDILDLVKLASKNLENVNPIEAGALSRSVAAMTGLPSTGVQKLPELGSQPWCPPMHTKPAPGGPRPPDPVAPVKSKPSRTVAEPPRRAASGGQRLDTLSQALDIGAWEPKRPQPTSAPAANTWERGTGVPPPRGKLFDTKLTSSSVRGLVANGERVMGSSSTGLEAPVNEMVAGYSIDPYDRAALHPETHESAISSPPPRIPRAPSLGPLATHGASGYDLPSKVAGAAFLASSASARVASPSLVAAARRTATPPNPDSTQRVRIAADDSGCRAGNGKELRDRQVQNALLSLVGDTPATVSYNLPRHATQLYQQQTEPMIKTSPQSIVFACQKWQDENALVDAPFERVLQKLPPDIRPSSAGPSGGPMLHPNEPIWFEMQHRLHGILKRQGRRADRRRKRKLRSKLFRGRTKTAPTKRDEGKELREYLDRHKAELQAETLQQPAGGSVGRETGEFLGKVHETYLVHRERAESRPFRLMGTGTSYAGKKGVGEMRPRKQAVVRPVYVPPPPSSMAGR